MKVTANATRTGDWWAIEVPEVPGVFTQAKRLDQVPGMVADAVALMEDVDPAVIEVAVVPAVPVTIQAALARAQEQRAQAEALNVEASTLVRQVALDLTAAGYSLRDIGEIIGVSHQRVAQLLEPRPMTIKEAGEAVKGTSSRQSQVERAKARKAKGISGGYSRAAAQSRAAAALSQTPRRGKSAAVAARAARQPKS